MLGLPQRKLSGKRSIRLEAAAFGKHPAWRDHIDEDALVHAATAELKFIETWLHGSVFEEHLRRNTFAGMPGNDVIDLDHLVVRRLNTGTSLTRVWASTDYSRRSMFPMMVSVDAEGVGMHDALMEVLPALRNTAETIRASAMSLRSTIDASDHALAGTVDTDETRRTVHAAMELLRTQLKNAANRLNQASDDLPASDARELVQRLRASPESGPADTGLARVIYRLEKLRASDQGARQAKPDSVRHWRIPRGTESAEECILRWAALLSCFTDPLLECTFAAPEHAQWVDLFTGTPDASSLEKLRLSDHAEPPENRAAYASVDDVYIASVSTLLDQWIKDGPRTAAHEVLGSELSEQGDRASVPAKKSGRGWRNWFGGAGLLGLAILPMSAVHLEPCSFAQALSALSLVKTPEQIHPSPNGQLPCSISQLCA
jgi:hypothetical protein